jgi:hypothetical protein
LLTDLGTFLLLVLKVKEHPSFDEAGQGESTQTEDKLDAVNPDEP